jgi:UDP-arabinose 4-epimerase
MDAQAILVTGGAGYIGSHACKLLAASGYRPVVFDNLSRGHASLVRWGELVVGDIRDRAALNSVFRRYRPAAVLHFAALAYVGESVTDPAPYFETNTAGTLQLLNAMLEHNVKQIVFSSTCATYGVPPVLPITEASPQSPTSPYGLSKLFVEGILRTYSQAYGVRAMILRYFNACGADPEGEIGEMHDPEPHLIPRALMAAAGEIDALDIYGTDYPTPDGTCIRDYVHVSDLAKWHLAALRKLFEGCETMALNLGTGSGFSVSEIVRSVERITGLRVPVRERERRQGDPPEVVADGSLAARVLGVSPAYTRLDDIVQTAWNWQRNAPVKAARVSVNLGS